MPAPLTDDERTRIADAIRTGTPRNEIARSFSRSPSTITSIATAAGLSFDRAATKHASDAARADGKVRRAALLVRLYGLVEHDVQRLEQLNDGQRYRLVMGTGSGKTIDQEVTTAPERDRVAIATQMGIHLDKIRVLESMDSAGGEGRSMIERLVEGLAAVADAA